MGLADVLSATAQTPDRPGIYCFLASDGELLYVGKARSLRGRLHQHAAAQAKGAGSRLGLLYDTVSRVRWEECADENAALAREADLIVALQPRFNGSHILEGRWVYLAAIQEPNDVVRFMLQQSPTVEHGRVYGCFPHLGSGVGSRRGITCSDGYSAFLRLVWAASGEPGHIPSRISRKSPPESFSVRVDSSLMRSLHSFLSGTNSNFLARLDHAALDRDDIVRLAVATDRFLAQDFFLNGPAALLELRRRHALPTSPLTKQQIVDALAAELRESIGAFVLPPEPTPRDGFLGRRARRWSSRRP